MTQHTDLIERLRGPIGAIPPDIQIEAANALEATAKNALEAMPHDIPQRMKDAICEETGWSGSMVSRMYTELRKAFTGEPYKANEDLDAALLEVTRLRKDAERYAWLRDKAQYHGGTRPVAWLTRSNGDGTPDSHLTWLDYEDLDEAIDEAMKGQP